MTNIYSFENKAIAVKGRQIMCKCQEAVAHMPKNYKYQIGCEILTQSSKIMYSIYDALDYVGFDKNKLDKVSLILDNIRWLVLSIRVAKDLNIINTDVFEKLVNMIVSLKTQSLNWKIFVEEKLNAE